MRDRRQILGLIFAILILVSFLAPPGQHYYYLQEKQRMSVGAALDIPGYLPQVLAQMVNIRVKEGESLLAEPVLQEPGKIRLELKLFGWIPFKEINVDVLPSIELVPGGHSIGVMLRTEGVMVVGFSPVLNQNSQPVFPAKEADIKIGDIIVTVNGIQAVSDDQVKSLIASAKDPQAEVNLVIRRDNQEVTRKVKPQYCYDTKSYRIGLFVRDNAGGVGTLTFYDPKSKIYGALGHVISDAETNQRIKIRQGKILAASVEGIQIAKRGEPGEKIGIFAENGEIGNIIKNESCGIYGVLSKGLSNSLYPGTLPVAYSNQIHTGKAQILTVIQGEEVKQFDINLEKLMIGREDGKNMIICITDPELLQKTGGIIQGMSGSPIIQDGKIIGAVTHVFVNDPTRGYGVFIENMLQESGIMGDQKQTLGLKSQGFIFF